MRDERTGFTTPKLLTAELLDQIPPLGLADNINVEAFVQNGLEFAIVGIMVLVTDMFIWVDEGHTVGFGVDAVL